MIRVLHLGLVLAALLETSRLFFGHGFVLLVDRPSPCCHPRQPRQEKIFECSSQLHLSSQQQQQQQQIETPVLSGFQRMEDIIIQEVYVAHVETLRDRFPSFEGDGDGSNSNGNTAAAAAPSFNEQRQRGIMKNGSPITITQEEECDVNDDEYCNMDSHVANLQFYELVGDDEVVLLDTVRKRGAPNTSRAFHLAGPRKNLHFDPSQVNAAILSAGGLCCGINNIIRELVHSLYYLYGANKVWGIQGGFRGFHIDDNDDNNSCPPILLTIDLVENIHHEGGTILGSSRGGFDIEKIFAFVEQYDINQLFIIGGDGTHRGAYAIHQASMERGVELAVAGIPKTIDK